MDSAAARWKRPWEDANAPPLRQHHLAPAHHQSPPADNRALPAFADDGQPAPAWALQARRESAVRRLYLAEPPSASTAAQMLQGQSDASQNTKRRRLAPDQPSQNNPHSSARPADSAGYHGSGEDLDDSARSLASERGHQHLPPASPGMSSARFDVSGLLPVANSQDDRSCCGPACSGLACARRRALIHEIVAEVDTLNSSIQRLTLRSDSQPRSHSSGVARLGTDQALAFAVDLLRSNVASLRDLTSHPSYSSGEGVEHQPANTAAAAELRDVMKRRFDPNTNSEIPPFLPRPPSGDRDPSRIIPLPGHPEDFRRSFQGSRDPLSPRHSPTGAHSINSGNAYTRPPSPTHNHPPHRMLPSPTSLNIPPPSTIHSLSSPSPSLLPQPSSSSAAHTAHLQDLQHQISLKTLALQTLRQEYDALLSKLDRQRTKCSALEKKFEVSDVEINSLTTEKEELEAKVAALEQQVEELREQRDDARRRDVQTGEQYRSIVEMASRLQEIAAEEKRAWAQEREGLLKALGWDNGGEGGQGSSTQEPNVSSTARLPASDLAKSSLDSARSLFDANIPDRQPEQASAAATSQVIAALRVEVAQLRSRTQSLEAAIRSIRDQGTAVEEASQAAAEAGKRMREAAREAIGES